MTDYVAVPRVVVEELVESPLVVAPAMRSDLLAALSREARFGASTGPARPPWHLATNALAELRRLVADRGPRAVAELDQLRGTIRDELDKLEVSLYDENAVYHGLVWVGLVTELGRYGYANGAIDGDTYRAVSEISATIASALLEYVPREVLERGT